MRHQRDAVRISVISTRASGNRQLRSVSGAPGYLAPFFEGFKPRIRPHGGELRHRSLTAPAAGDRASARRVFMLAIRRNPAHLKTYLRLLRTFLPMSMVQMTSAKARRRPQPGSPNPG